MFQNRLIEPIGLIIAAIVFLFSLLLFYRDTGAFLESLAAAVLASALIWISYVLFRLIFLVFRNK